MVATLSGVPGLLWRRVEAVDGRLLDCELLRELGYLRDSDLEKRRQLRPAEVGVWFSHVLTWLAVAHDTSTEVVILEDDVHLNMDGLRALPGRSRALADSGVLADLLYLGWNEGAGSWAPNPPTTAKLLPGGFFRLARGCPGAYGYAVTKTGAARLLDEILAKRIEMPIDEVAATMARDRRLTAVCTVPPIVRHGFTALGRTFESTVADYGTHVKRPNAEYTLRLMETVFGR